MKRFTLLYDEEYDKDIADLLQSVPTKRRSEKIRSLIREGLCAEENRKTTGGMKSENQVQNDHAVQDRVKKRRAFTFDPE